MCLVVDKGIIASVLEKEDGKMPYFMAVDVTNWQEEGDGCEGHFKVAIDYILSNLYPCLGMEMLPKELLLLQPYPVDTQSITLVM